MTRSSTAAATVPPSVVILGSDALLTALPATPTQLANACYAAGFEGVFPASWGDELVAAGCLKNLETRVGPAILCTCPLVSEQLRGVAPLQRFQLHLISPPVAAARYLRALCDDAPLRITYVGDCPGAENDVIDEHVSPSDFLSRLAERGITPMSQRPDLGANVPRDRRRFYSLPGGAPTPEWLSADWPKRILVDTDAGDALADLAHHALARESTLIDFAPQLGCACSGSIGGIAPAEARKAVAELEPQRARQEVLDPDLRVAVESLVPMGAGGEEVTWDDFLASLPGTLAPDGSPGDAAVHPGASAPPPQRRSREGAVLPRAYATPRVTRRRAGAGEGSISGEMPAVRASAPVPETRLTPAPAMSTAVAPASTRSTQPVPRRSQLVEGASIPRFPVPVRPAITPADRWLLIAIVLGASALSASVASYLTVRATAGRPAPVSASGTVAVAPPQHAVAPLPAVRDSEATVVRVDPPASLQSLRATPPPLGDQRTLAAAAAPRGRPMTPAPAPAKLQRRGKPVVIPPAPPPAPAPPLPRDASADAPPIVIPVAPMAATSPAPVAATPAPSVAPTDSAPPAAAAVAAPVPAAASTVAAPPAAPPVDIAAELKAIREELNARKHRVDSLSRSLDSLKSASPPR